MALVDDEILINNKNKGFYIQEIHSDSARMKLDIMMQLDAYAAELAIDNISDSDISEMEDIIHRLDLAIEQHDYGFTTIYRNLFMMSTLIFQATII